MGGLIYGRAYLWEGLPVPGGDGMARIDRQADRQAGRHRQAGTQADRHTDRHADTQTRRPIEAHTAYYDAIALLAMGGAEHVLRLCAPPETSVSSVFPAHFFSASFTPHSNVIKYECV
jgi:hypothetical protein